MDADSEESGEGLAMSVIVTPPTPHLPRGREVEGADGHERALGDVDEHEEEEEEEELPLSDIEQGGGGAIDWDDEDEDEGDEDDEVEEAAGAVHLSNEKRRQGALLYSTAAQEDEEQEEEEEDGKEAAEISTEVEQSAPRGERLLDSSLDSSSQVRNEDVDDDGGQSAEQSLKNSNHLT